MGNIQSEVFAKEHDGESQPGVLEPKKVGMYGWDYVNLMWRKSSVTSDGTIKVTY